MKHLLKFIVFFVLLMGFCACQHQYPASLVEADSLLYKNPQLAFSKLRSYKKYINPKHLEDYNYWYLLTLMSKERSCHSIESDSTLGKLLSFYENKHDVSNLAYAYYLQGRLMQEYHEYPLALSYFHKTLNMLDLKDNLRLRGLANSQVGSILMDFGNVSLASDYYERALNCDSAMGDFRGLVYDMRDLAIADMERGNSAVALSKLYAALSLAQKSNQQALVNDVRLQMANVYFYGTDKLDSVWTNLLPSLKKTSPNFSSACLAAAEYYWTLEKDDSAKFYLEKVTNNGNIFQKCEAYKRLVTIFSYEDDLLSLDTYNDHYMLLNDSIAQIKEKEYKMKGQDLLKFMSQQDEIEQLQKSNRHKLFWALLFLLLLLLVIVAFVVYYQMSVVRKLKVRNKLASIKLLAFSSEARFADKHQSIYDKLQLGVYVESEKCLHNKNWEDLEKEVEKLYPDFKNKLCSCHKLSDFEYQICMLVKIGVKTSQIAILTAHSKPSVSTAKQRLYKKMTTEQGKAEDLNRLLMYF